MLLKGRYYIFFFILSTSSNSSHKRPKAQIRLYRMDIEMTLMYVSASHAHYIRLNTYVFKYIISLNSGIHHFIKKHVGPHAGPHHFINPRFLVNHFFRVFLDRLMLQHVINEIPLGTSFYKQSTFADHFINTFGL